MIYRLLRRLRLRHQGTEADEMLELAWGLIANAGWDAHRGDVFLEKSPGWHEAAIRWRDSYFRHMSEEKF